MFNVQLFEEKSIASLQQAVNDWLHLKKDVAVIHSGLQSTRHNTHTFYVLYTTAEAKIEELKEMAA
ncbi:MAG TPA: hypothetical protein VFV68_08475, partial [Agriterribacter sp.]|nr:hypothetical protein [Agriterribacter sp.]